MISLTIYIRRNYRRSPGHFFSSHIMDALNAKEQQEFSRVVEQKQMKDFMRLYSNLVDRCFADCVNDFTSNKLTSREEGCVNKCSEKFLKHSERVGARFQEQNQLMMQNLRR